jgi:hypothetical protein
MGGNFDTAECKLACRAAGATILWKNGVDARERRGE